MNKLISKSDAVALASNSFNPVVVQLAEDVVSLYTRIEDLEQQLRQAKRTIDALRNHT